MKEVKKNKAYRIQIGSVQENTEFENFDSMVVIAVDVLSAIRKVRLRKGCYVSQVEIITRIDKM